MNLQELTKSVLAEYGPELVVVRIAELHNEEVTEGYYVPLCALDTKLIPVVQSPPMTLKVEWVTEEFLDDFGGSRYIDVSGFNGKTWGEYDDNWPAESAHEPARSGLEGCAWEEWAGFTVPQDMVELWEFAKVSGLEPTIPPIDFVAACLWEMTFISFDEAEVAATMAEYSRSAEEFKAGVADGSIKLTPLNLDELAERLAA